MFARTTRLFLRPGWTEDIEAIHAAFDDEVIAQNLSTPPWPYTVCDAHSFLCQTRHIQHPNLLITRRTAGAPQVIGSIGISPMQGSDQIELGYWISRQHWGLGYATEAARAMLDIAGALGYKEIMAEHFTDNPASGKVLRKLGFHSTGRVLNRHSNGRGKSAPVLEYKKSLAKNNASEEAMRSLAA